MTQLDDFQNPLIFSNSPFAQQVLIIIEDDGDSKWTKGQTRYFQNFQKILGIWVHKTLQGRHACVLTPSMRNLKHTSRNTDQFLELRLPRNYLQSDIVETNRNKHICMYVCIQMKNDN